MANMKRRKKDSARLVWDSKPRRAPNPRDIEFQTAEIVIPNWQRDSQQLPFSFQEGMLEEPELDKQKMNRLIWGDNLLAMQALLAHGYEGKINLIYIDPPFATSEDYYFKLKLNGEEFTKEPSFIERLAYKDTWAGGIDSYLDMLYPRLQLMKRLLAEDGTLYIHADCNIGPYIRLVADEVFGRDRFRNEIIWYYTNKLGTGGNTFDKHHDNLFIYVKGENWCHNPLMRPVKKQKLQPVTKKIEGQRVWLRDEEGKRIYEMGRPETKIGDVWEVPYINPMASERIGFDTQKPEKLLENVIFASSDEGDLVADFFCGSGTTLIVAEKLGRRWIGCDFSKVSLQIARSRLVQMDAKPFLIENIGNYQREMIYLSGGRIYEMQRIILKLYGATPHLHYRDLGTRQAPEDGVLELVYVGYPDRPVTAKKAEELARQAEALDGTGYKRLVILAWDYDYNYSTELENRLKAAKTPIKTKIVNRSIPPDIYDYLKKAKDEGEIEPLREKIQFHEKPYLKLSQPTIKSLDNGKVKVTIGLERYVLFDLPVKEKERQKLLELMKDNFAVLIDYWAVDWDYDGRTFKSQWQEMRGAGRRTKVVTTQASAELETGKRYTIAVRVVDVFGNDAAGTVEVNLLE